jgi:hypothetical protein
MDESNFEVRSISERVPINASHLSHMLRGSVEDVRNNLPEPTIGVNGRGTRDSVVTMLVFLKRDERARASIPQSIGTVST